MKDFVPKKTITVELPLESVEKFNKLSQSWNLNKGKTVERMISEAYNDLFSEQCI